MRYASRYTLRLCRSTKMRNASRSPASVCSTATASLSMMVSTLGLIRFIRQDFGVAVRFIFERALAVSFLAVTDPKDLDGFGAFPIEEDACNHRSGAGTQ